MDFLTVYLVQLVTLIAGCILWVSTIILIAFKHVTHRVFDQVEETVTDDLQHQREG